MPRSMARSRRRGAPPRTISRRAQGIAQKDKKKPAAARALGPLPGARQRRAVRAPGCQALSPAACTGARSGRERRSRGGDARVPAARGAGRVSVSYFVRYDIAVADLKRSEEHTSELQSPCNLVCRLLLEKKK